MQKYRERYANVYLAPDRTRKEKSAQKELVEKLKKIRGVSESAFYIMGEVICEKRSVKRDL